jgi:hypothetical protein
MMIQTVVQSTSQIWLIDKVRPKPVGFAIPRTQNKQRCFHHHMQEDDGSLGLSEDMAEHEATQQETTLCSEVVVPR